MDMTLVIISGTLGSLAGAYANYFVASWLGRGLLIKYGHKVFIREAHIERVEQFFLNHGEVSTFIGRLLPVIRHLISIPAGLARMNHWRFTLYTLAGAGLWVATLSWLGYLIGAQKELIQEYAHEAVLGAIALSTLIAITYMLMHRRRVRRSLTPD